MIKNKIKILRAGRNLTQEELAEKAGVTRQTILAMEKINIRFLLLPSAGRR